MLQGSDGAELLGASRLRVDPQAKLDELFVRWLNEDETKCFVVDLLDSEAQRQENWTAGASAGDSGRGRNEVFATNRASEEAEETTCAEAQADDQPTCSGSRANGDVANPKKRFAIPDAVDDCEAAMMSPSAMKRPRENYDLSTIPPEGACCSVAARSALTTTTMSEHGDGECDGMNVDEDGLRPATLEQRWRSLSSGEESRRGASEWEVEHEMGPGSACTLDGSADWRHSRAATAGASKDCDDFCKEEEDDMCPLCWSYVDSTVDSCSIVEEGDSYGSIPRFYFPCGRPVSYQFKVVLARQLCTMFPSHDDPNAELDDVDMVRVTMDVLGLASFFTPLVMERIGVSRNGGITRAAFQRWFCTRTGSAPPLCACTPETRAFTVLRRDPSRAYLTKEDVLELIRTVVVRHVGLAFLSETPEFQESYALTVVHRIFYGINRRLDGRLTLHEFERSDFIDVCREVDMTDDINSVLRYFSYEHFYVIFCKFTELGGNKDRMITRDALLRYADFALTSQIIDRVVGGAPLLRWSASHDSIGYEDFVYFILSEEDKNTLPAIKYWFRCVDVDGDGSISYREMEYFYRQQIERMGEFHQDIIHFQDILCQLIDMIKPRSRGSFHICDLFNASSGSSSVFFNCLFNLNKFYQFEWRDPLTYRLENMTSDWEKFAQEEYMRLAQAASDDERIENYRTGHEGSADELSPISPANAHQRLDCDETGSDLDASPQQGGGRSQLYIDAIDFESHLRIGCLEGEGVVPAP